MDYVKLNNGVAMPQLGIGTFLLAPQDARASVTCALKCGYRLVDTANAYCNEKSVGVGIKDSGVPREDVFVSTKLWATEYENENAVDETLARLGLDYIDLLFIHQPTKNWRSGYEKLVKAYKEGKIRSIGISNFEDHIEEVLNEFDVIPQVIQVECHPNYPQDLLRRITDSKDIRIMCWYPLGGKGNSSLLGNETIKHIAKAHEKSPAQVILRWHVQMGFIVIPGSKNEEHIRDNMDLFDFELTDSEMKEMASLNTGKRIYTPTEGALAGFAMWHPTYEK